MNHSNNAFSVLNGSITNVATAITVATGTGSRFPASNFMVTLVGYDGSGNENAWEICKCTSRSGDVLTVARGQESTTAVAWANATRIENRITAGTMNMLAEKDAANTFTANQTIQGSLTFDGLLRRILGDFSNATGSNRPAFQSSVVDGGTTVNALPNGSGNFANYAVFDSSDADNSGYGYFGINATHVRINTSKTGTGTAKPFKLSVNSVDRLEVTPNGEWGLSGANYGTSGQAIKSQGAGQPAIWGDVGDVVGPASATDNALVRFDTTTGKLVQNSTATLSDTGGLAGITSINGGQLAGLRNKIINGKMEIAQRGTSFPALAAGAYSLDRWCFNNSSAAVATFSQGSSVPSSNEYLYSLSTSITTADTSIAATDASTISQQIEGYNVRDLIGKTFTISFWVRSSKTGVHCVSLRNSNADRSYVSEYSISAANTWEQKTVTVSGGLTTAGTWNWTNGVGLYVAFALASGSNYHTTAGAWNTGNLLATSSQVNCLDTIGNIFAITGVQLEVGSVATPFEHRPYGMELALCQRYYYRISPAAGYHFGALGTASTSTAAKMVFSFPVEMRTSPSALEQSGTASNYGIEYDNTATVCSSVPTFYLASKNTSTCTFSIGSAIFTARQCVIARAETTSGYLGWSAEL